MQPTKQAGREFQQPVGLGTAGVTYGAVSTAEGADASGVHGDASAVTQGFSGVDFNVATGRSTVYGASAVSSHADRGFGLC